MNGLTLAGLGIALWGAARLLDTAIVQNAWCVFWRFWGIVANRVWPNAKGDAPL
jgi:hypothetical protein